MVETMQAPAAPAPSALRRHPFFGIVMEPKAYTSLVYLLLAMATGIFYFTWATTGLSLSLGLAILIIGVPFAALFLLSVRALAHVESRVAGLLLDVELPAALPAVIPEGAGFLQRAGRLFTEARTWKALVYFFLQMPLGIAYFTFFITAGSLSLALLTAPFGHWVFGVPMGIDFGMSVWPSSNPSLVLGLFLGVLGCLVTLHLALLAGRLHGMLAKALLSE